MDGSTAEVADEHGDRRWSSGHQRWKRDGVFIITAGASSYSQVQECFPPLSLLNFSLSFIFSLGRSNNASFFVGNGKTEVEQENSLGYKIDKEEMETLVKHRDPLLLLLLEF
jgi:hypothetical protein